MSMLQHQCYALPLNHSTLREPFLGLYESVDRPSIYLTLRKNVSWKCTATTFILISLVLSAALAYFIYICFFNVSLHQVDCLSSNCGGHGVCYNGLCLCSKGWRGSDCSQFEPEPLRCLPDCSRHGIFNIELGQCECDPPWMGIDCSQEKCDLDCGPHGQCHNGECLCEKGWTGARCDLSSLSSSTINLTSSPQAEVTLIPPNFEITMLTREILNFTNDNIAPINEGLIKDRLLTPADSFSILEGTTLTPNLSITGTGYIENTDNISTFNGFIGQYESQSSPSTLSPSLKLPSTSSSPALYPLTSSSSSLTSSSPLTSTVSSLPILTTFPTINTESPISGMIIDVTSGQPQPFNTMIIDVTVDNTTTTTTTDNFSSNNNSTVDMISPFSIYNNTININDVEILSDYNNTYNDNVSLKNSTQSTSTSTPPMTQSATTSTTMTTKSIISLITSTPSTTILSLSKATSTQHNEPLTSSTPSTIKMSTLTSKAPTPTTTTTVSSSSNKSDIRTEFNSTNAIHDQARSSDDLLLVKVVNTTDEPFNQTDFSKSMADNLFPTNQTEVGNVTVTAATVTGKAPTNQFVTRKVEITLNTTPLTTLMSNLTNTDQTSTLSINFTLPDVELISVTINSTGGENGNFSDLQSKSLNPSTLTNLFSVKKNDSNEENQSTIHPVERSIVENSSFSMNFTIDNDQSDNRTLSDYDLLSTFPVTVGNKSDDWMIKNLTNTNQLFNKTISESTIDPIKETERLNTTGPFTDQNNSLTDQLLSNLTESWSNGTVDFNNNSSLIASSSINNTMESMIGTTVSPLECNPKQIRCFIGQDREACLAADVVCDGVRDCLDGSDEYNCLTSCGSNFKCGNESRVTCISRKYHCDGLWDCEDGSDESTCYFASCENQLSCADKSSCLLPIQVCDGKYDCRDHSDEQECVDHSTCLSVGKFFCDNLCIEYSLRCDGSKDCVDGTDESNCTCTTDKFKCWNGDCLEKSMVCDGHGDCLDSSDEWSCVKTDENDVVSMVNPSTGNWALLCADESLLDESDYSLLCQKMGLEYAVNYSSVKIATVGEVEWVTYNGSAVFSSENCNSSTILKLSCQTFKCSMMATPLEPISSPAPILLSPIKSLPSSTTTAATTTAAATTSGITDLSNTTFSSLTTTSTLVTTINSTSPPIVASSPSARTTSDTTSTSSMASTALTSTVTSTTTTGTTLTTSTSPTLTFSSTSTVVSTSSTTELPLPSPNLNIPLSRSTRATSPNEIQSMVIVKANSSESTNKNQCLAQIISPMWLLSSAECLRQIPGVPLIVEANTSRSIGAVSRVVIHPHSSKFRYLHIRDFDLALINLREALPLSSSLMSSICLPESDVASDITCFMPVIGETEARPYLIQDRSMCNDRRHFNSSLGQRQICASASDESPNSQSVPDPGSNLVCLSSSTEWFIGGFVSFASPRTSYTKHPSVFSNVFAMKDFINKVVAVNLYRSKSETSYGYTFDLNYTLDSTGGQPPSNNYTEPNKTDNLTATHDQLKKENSIENSPLNNGTDNLASNQSTSDTDLIKRIADRSRSLDKFNSTVDGVQLNGERPLSGNVSYLQITDNPVINNQSLKAETLSNDRRNDYDNANPNTLNNGRSIDLTNTVNQNESIVNQMNISTTVEPLTTTHKSIILKESTSYPTTLSPMPSSPLTSSFSSSDSSTSSTTTTSTSPTTLQSTSSLPIPSTPKADKTLLEAIKTSTGPSTINLTVVDASKTISQPNGTSKL